MNGIPNADIVRKIQKLYRDNQLAQKFFDALSQRSRDATATTVENIMRLRLSRGDAYNLAKAVAGTGCAELVLGRRKSKTRLVWTFSCISIGQAAAGENVELEGIHDAEPEIDDEDDETATPIVADIADTTANLSISEAKRLLAKSLGVDERNVEIIIKA